MKPARLPMIVLTAAGIFLVSGSPTLAGEKSYSEKEIMVKEIKSKNGQVEILFQSKAETLYYCPGANAKTTDKTVELVFVRASINAKPKLTHPAKNVKKGSQLLRSITVSPKGKTIFLRDGNRLVQLFPKDKE